MFLCTLYGRRLQTVVVFMLSGREPSAAFEPNGATLISNSRAIGCSITHSSSFLISDPGGCFVSNELREWASVRSIGLLTAPGEFHGLSADLENLIRVIRRLARKLAGRPS